MWKFKILKRWSIWKTIIPMEVRIVLLNDRTDKIILFRTHYIRNFIACNIPLDVSLTAPSEYSIAKQCWKYSSISFLRICHVFVLIYSTLSNVVPFVSISLLKIKRSQREHHSASTVDDSTQRCCAFTEIHNWQTGIGCRIVPVKDQGNIIQQILTSFFSYLFMKAVRTSI